jgi:hypothetical protein
MRLRRTSEMAAIYIDGSERRDRNARGRGRSCATEDSPTRSREGDAGGNRSQTLAGSSRGTITLCAVPVISMQRHVEGRCGTEFGPLKVS